MLNWNLWKARRRLESAEKARRELEMITQVKLQFPKRPLICRGMR